MVLKRSGTVTKRSTIKPLYMMQEEGLDGLEKRAVMDGVKEILQVARATLPISDFGVWRHRDHKQGDSLKPYYSVDWYLQMGRETGVRGQLNADELIISLMREPWKDESKGGQEHYDLMVVHSDITSVQHKTNFVIGLALLGIGTVVSTHRFRTLENRTRYECVKTETMHELGHVFGLIPSDRKENVDYSLGLHCTNVCTMRQGLRVPIDWIRYSQERLDLGSAFCNRCTQDLENFFH